MPTEIIELKDGLRVEVEALPAGKLRQTSTNVPLDAAIGQARELLLKAVEPVTSVWGELNKDLSIDQVQIELALGFEATGSMFIAQAKGNASIKFTMTVRPTGK
jgi:hypothetical protein